MHAVLTPSLGTVRWRVHCRRRLCSAISNPGSCWRSSSFSGRVGSSAALVADLKTSGSDHEDHEACHAHEPHEAEHDEHYAPSGVSRFLSSVGIVQLSSALAHSGKWTALSIACFALSVMAGSDMAARLMGSLAARWLHALSLGGTLLLSGLPQAVEAVCIAGSGQLDTHVLMSLAVIGTLVMGMAQEGALLVLLFQISHALEEKFTARAKGNVERLFANVPTQATLVQLEDVTCRPLLEGAAPALARSVQPGQHVLVKPGEQVPLDGVVVWGSAGVSLQHISGESRPLRVEVGGLVPAGSLNLDGLLVVRVSATSDDSTPARIARMTAAAQSAKPKLERTLDRVGQAWSKAVIGVTLLTLIGLPLLAGVPLLGPGGAFYRAMGVLTAGSPCAVVLVPLAYVCAIATVTRRGVLVKSAASLELLGQCSTVALDKTGTTGFQHQWSSKQRAEPT